MLNTKQLRSEWFLRRHWERWLAGFLALKILPALNALSSREGPSFPLACLRHLRLLTDPETPLPVFPSAVASVCAAGSYRGSGAGTQLREETENSEFRGESGARKSRGARVILCFCPSLSSSLPCSNGAVCGGVRSPGRLNFPSHFRSAQKADPHKSIAPRGKPHVTTAKG